MEKKTFLAIFLSLMVLYAWNAFTVKDQPKPLVDSSLQQDTVTMPQVKAPEKQTSIPAIPESVSQKTMALPLVFEEKNTLISEKLKAEFSNIGGTLVKVTVLEHNHSLPVTNLLGLEAYSQAEFELEEQGTNNIVYSLNDGSGLYVRKEYTLTDSNLIEARVDVKNTAMTPKDLAVNIENYTIDTSSLDTKSFARDQSLMEYSINSPDGTIRKSNAFKFAKKEEKTTSKKINWVGFRDRYFCLVVKPEFNVDMLFVEVLGDKSMRMISKMPAATIQPGDKISFETKILVSPQDLAQLKGYGEGFDKIMAFTRFGLVDGISKVIYQILLWINSVIPSWGICIIIIAFLVYGVTYPLTMKSMLSMKGMQKIQPEVAALREKNKNNPQKLNQEIMELYKKHKVNPFGGCLPMVMQMPIFIGLYQVLWRSIFFKGASFLWIKDLSEPDRLIYPLPVTIPFLGNEFNILPILMGITMFFQQKITSKNMVVSDPAQASQQKMMTTFFPIFLTVIFYKFASGLALYFTIFYGLSSLTQLKIAKMTKAE